MGLSSKQNNVVYLVANKGKMIRRVKEETSASISRVIEKGKNKGTTVHEEHYDSVDGKIIGFYKRESEVSFQKKPYKTLEIIIKDDDGSTFQLSCPYSSNYTKGFIARIDNVDLDKAVEICTYWIKGDDDKERPYLGMFQGFESGERVKIEPKYSKELKNLPEVKAVQVGDDTHYDDTELLKFYDQKIKEYESKFKISSGKIPSDDTQSGAENTNNQKDEDEVPF